MLLSIKFAVGTLAAPPERSSVGPVPLTFYFDFISPYAYLAWARLVRRGQPFELRPLLFAVLLAHHGQLGPAEIPAKRAWLISDTLRQAHGLKIKQYLTRAFALT